VKRHAVATKLESIRDHIEIITLDKAQELEDMLVRPAGFAHEARETQRRINELGTHYRWNLWASYQRQPKLLRAKLRQLSEDIGAALATLDQFSALLTRRLNAAFGDDQGVTAATCREHLTRLQEAAERASAALPSGAGRASVDELRVLCAGLAEVYADLAGEQFTFDAHPQGRGRYAFLTNGARWVAHVAKIIDPEVTDASLVTAMRGWQKPPRKIRPILPSI
jgi:hypothetical protein